MVPDSFFLGLPESAAIWKNSQKQSSTKRTNKHCISEKRNLSDYHWRNLILQKKFKPFPLLDIFWYRICFFRKMDRKESGDSSSCSNHG